MQSVLAGLCCAALCKRCAVQCCAVASSGVVSVVMLYFTQCCAVLCCVICHMLRCALLSHRDGPRALIKQRQSTGHGGWDDARMLPLQLAVHAPGFLRGRLRSSVGMPTSCLRSTTAVAAMNTIWHLISMWFAAPHVGSTTSPDRSLQVLFTSTARSRRFWKYVPQTISVLLAGLQCSSY
jgi:hypothetical protein